MRKYDESTHIIADVDFGVTYERAAFLGVDF